VPSKDGKDDNMKMQGLQISDSGSDKTIKDAPKNASNDGEAAVQSV